jgi:RNA polymerase sigma factor (sigma-70 family)
MPISASLLAELIDNQGAALRLWIRSRCEASEDVVQEAFCRLVGQEPPPDNPVAWLYAVCRNLAEKQRRSDHRRRQREQRHAEPEQSSSQAADSLELAETVAAVETLDEGLREVLVARIWGGLSFEEVARLCGISTATACRRYATALEQLRSKLESRCEKRE